MHLATDGRRVRKINHITFIYCSLLFSAFSKRVSATGKKPWTGYHQDTASPFVTIVLFSLPHHTFCLRPSRETPSSGQRRVLYVPLPASHLVTFPIDHLYHLRPSPPSPVSLPLQPRKSKKGPKKQPFSGAVHLSSS